MTRSTRPNVSAGLLLFRRPDAGLELFIAHPGGPFWKDRDAGAWTIPKGIVESGEDFLDAARREFEEETGIHPVGPFIPLGSKHREYGENHRIPFEATQGGAHTALPEYMKTIQELLKAEKPVAGTSSQR